MKTILQEAIRSTEKDLEEVSLESQLFNEVDDLMSVAMTLEAMDHQALRLEEIESVMGDLEALQISLESLIENNAYGSVESISIRERFMSLESRADVEYDMPSFEDVSQGGLDEAYLTLEAITGIWNRLKQAYVSVWHSFMDGMASLIKGVDKFAAKHVVLAGKLKKTWAAKKGKISGKTIKTSLAGASVLTPYTVNGQLVKSPLLALKNDSAHAKYMLDDYLTSMTKYLGQVETIVSRGDYTSDAGFEKSVLKDMSKLQHPKDVFKLSIVGKGNLLMMNRGLMVKVGKPVKPVAVGLDYKKLSELLIKSHVREYVSTKSLFKVDVIHDVFLEPKDIDTMLTLYGDLAGLLEDTSGRLSVAMKAAKNITELNTDKLAGDRLSGTNRAAVKQIGRFIKQLPVYLNRPTKKEINRVSGIVSGTRTLLSRTIATAK